jgi:hypothetical protein
MVQSGHGGATRAVGSGALPRASGGRHDDDADDPAARRRGAHGP